MNELEDAHNHSWQTLANVPRRPEGYLLKRHASCGLLPGKVISWVFGAGTMPVSSGRSGCRRVKHDRVFKTMVRCDVLLRRPSTIDSTISSMRAMTHSLFYVRRVDIVAGRSGTFSVKPSPAHFDSIPCLDGYLRPSSIPLVLSQSM